MASRSGMFLKKEARVELIQELKNKGELKPGEVPEEVSAEAQGVEAAPDASFGTGCLTCGEDDDHANLLLCEACNDEYHTYCLDPPLRSVPATDWFCDSCKMPFDDDGLDKLVNALSPKWTSRFGEVCWSQGGVGFGWWPAFIYDPRFTVGSARQLARKNLGKRHLVYFFECHDAPFAVLPDSKVVKWDDGLLDDYHLGRAARASGKARTKAFQQAMQAATVEAGKPIEMRMNWNHSDQPQILPSPKMASRPKNGRKRGRHDTTDTTNSDGEKRQSIRSSLSPPSSTNKTSSRQTRSTTPGKPKSANRRGFDLMSPAETSLAEPSQQRSSRRNLNKAIAAVSAAAANPIESSEDGELVCKLFLKKCTEITTTPTSPTTTTATATPKTTTTTGAATTTTTTSLVNIGFVKLESRKQSTFADARIGIVEQLVPDCIEPQLEWRFLVPNLGPVSAKQEQTLGPMFPFLRKTTADAQLGKGTLIHPLKVIIVDSSGLDGGQKGPI